MGTLKPTWKSEHFSDWVINYSAWECDPFQPALLFINDNLFSPSFAPTANIAVIILVIISLCLNPLFYGEASEKF